MIPEWMPTLAAGSHRRGSGRACVMNYLSYLNGDEVITDHPSCTHPLLAAVAIRLNDTICRHLPRNFTAGMTTDDDFEVLCPQCTTVMLEFAARLYGANQMSDDITQCLESFLLKLGALLCLPHSEDLEVVLTQMLDAYYTMVDDTPPTISDEQRVKVKQEIG